MRCNTILGHSTKCNIIACPGTKCSTIAWFGTNTFSFWRNVILSFGPAPTAIISTVRLSNEIISYHGTTVTISRSRQPMVIPAPNIIPLCATTFVVQNVIIENGLILVTAPNMFPDCLFINPLCALVVFKRSTDREWHNLAETSSNGRGDSLEQSCLDVGHLKTRRTLRQLLTII